MTGPRRDVPGPAGRRRPERPAALARRLPARPRPALDGAGRRQHGGVPRRGRRRRSCCRPAGRGCARRSSTGRSPRTRCPAILRRAVAQHPGARWSRAVLIVIVGLGHRGAADPARAAVVPGARAGRGLHRLLPRDAADHPAVPRRLRRARAAAAGRADLAGRARHARAGADLLGVRRGGVPGRHRVGAPEPAGGGPVARAVLRADDAAGGAPAGGTPGDAAAAQRLRGAAEGRRADLGAGRRSTRSGHAQIDVDETFNFTPYLVAGLLFVLLAIPTDPGRRLGQPARGAAAAGGGAL